MQTFCDSQRTFLVENVMYNHNIVHLSVAVSRCVKAYIDWFSVIICPL